jgi:hypothetical protein
MKTQTIPLCLFAGCLLLSLAAQADTHGPLLKANLQEIPRSACLARPQAEGEAEKIALKSAQTFCRSEGFGWRAALLKDLGKLDCQPCGEGRSTCAYNRAALECRKAEPQLSWNGWLSALSLQDR